MKTLLITGFEPFGGEKVNLDDYRIPDNDGNQPIDSKVV